MDLIDIQEIDNTIELEILAQFIWDTDFCFRFSIQAQAIEFNSPFINQIVRFCTHYFMTHMQAPGQEGIDKFLAEVLENGDEDHHFLYDELCRKAYRYKDIQLDDRSVTLHFKELREKS